MDLTQAITPELKRVCEPADPVLAHIEGVLESVVRAGVPVGDHHLGEPQAAEERAPTVVDVVEDQPLAR